MTRDPYTPPAAAVVDRPPDDARDAPFFVVSPTKVMALSICTLGVYQLFWFYMHWRRWRVGRSETVWPVARAIFALFYVHALERRIDQTLEARVLARHRGTFAAATVYLLLTALDIGSAIAWPWISYRVPDGWWWAAEWSSLLLVLPVTAATCILKRAANDACGDPDARSNRRFTIYNAAWMLGGVSLTAWVFYMETMGSTAL